MSKKSKKSKASKIEQKLKQSLLELKQAQLERDLEAQRLQSLLKEKEHKVELANLKTKLLEEIVAEGSSSSLSKLPPLKHEDPILKVPPTSSPMNNILFDVANTLAPSLPVKGKIETAPPPNYFRPNYETQSFINAQPVPSSFLQYGFDYCPPPRPKILQFDGDPLNYWTFARSFQAHIINKVSFDSAKMSNLLQHCKHNIKAQLEPQNLMGLMLRGKHCITILVGHV